MTVEVQIVKGLAKADERFVAFLRLVQLPITERQIIDYYREKVFFRSVNTGKWKAYWDKGSQQWEYENVDYTAEEIRKNALLWFDRCLGRSIRKQILLLDPAKLLPQTI